MNRPDAAFRWRCAAGLLISLMICSPAVLAQTKEQKAATKAESEREEGEGDAVRRREEWFYKQRRHPLGRIPGGARQRALDRVEEMRRAQREARANRPGADARASSSALSPLSPSTTWTHVGPMPALSFQSAVGFVAGRVSAIAVDPTNANTVFVGGAQGGVWKSTDGGTTWATTFDGSKSLAIGAIAIDPSNSNTIYVGTGEQNFSGDSYYGAGIYKSIDGGMTWTQTVNAITGCSTQIGVAACSVPTSFISPAAPFNENVGGVHISSIVVHPANPMKVFAGVQIFLNVGGGAFSGLYCSDDAGDHWTQVIAGAIGTDIQIHTANIGGIGAVAYAALGSFNGDTDPRDTVGQNGVYKSINANAPCGAQVWTPVSKAPVPTGINAGIIRIGVAPSDATAMTVYAAVGMPVTTANPKDNLAGVFRTIDGGNTWTTITPPTDFCGHLGTKMDGQCSYDLVVKVHPNDAKTVFLGGSRATSGGLPFYLIRTNNGLSASPTWTQIAQDSIGTTLHVDQHALAFGFSGANVTTLYVGNDGGIWSTPLLTPSSAVVWNNLNKGLEMIQFYPGLSIHPANNQITYAGTQDNGTEKMDPTFNPANPLEWNELDPCGDGGYTAIDPFTPSTVYVTCENINIQKSTANGAALTFVSIDSSIPQGDRSEFIAPLVLDPVNPQTLYFGTFRVWQTKNGGTNGMWTAISLDLTSGATSSDDITSISISPKNSNVVYVGTFGSATSGGIVQRTTQANLGAGALNTWVKIDGGSLPPRAITQVAADPNNQDVVFVTMSGFSGFMIIPPATDTQGHVFRCDAVAKTCADISGSGAGALPNIPVNAIVMDPTDANSNTIYIGTDVGVFGTTNGGATWIADYPGAPNGLPKVAVMGMAIHPASRILRVVTHGRGAWDLQLGAPPAPTLSAINPNNGVQGQTINNVTLTGTNLSGATINAPSGIMVSNVATSAAQITATFTIAANAATGAQNVSVTTAGGTSATVAFTINSDFTFGAASPASGTVSAPGGQTQTTIQLAPGQAGAQYPGTVTFSCSGLPFEANCLFSPISVMANAGPTAVKVTITTTAPSLVPPAVGRRSGTEPLRLLLSAVAALSLFGLLLTRGWARRWRYTFSLALLVIFVGLAMSCGGGGGGVVVHDPGTPVGGPTTITITATSGGVSHSSMFNLTVQ